MNSTIPSPNHRCTVCNAHYTDLDGCPCCPCEHGVGGFEVCPDCERQAQDAILMCEQMGGHQFEDYSQEGPDSATDHWVCKRCGFEIQHTYY